MLQHLITWAFQLSILATAFGFGLKAATEDVQDLIRRPALLGRSLLAIFVIVPIVAVALAHAFDFPHAAEIAMIALAISPLAALMPVNLIRVGRSFSFPAGLIAIVALMSVVVVPLLVALVGRFLGWSSPVSPLRAAGVVAAIVLLPLVAGMVVRALRPVLADRIELPASLIGTVVLRLATLALLLTSLHAIWALIVNGTVIAIAVVVVVGFAAGHVLGGPHPNGRTVLALAGGFRHPAVALATAGQVRRSRILPLRSCCTCCSATSSACRTRSGDNAAEVRSPMPRRRPLFWMRARRQSTTSGRDARRRTISLPGSSRTRPAARPCRRRPMAAMPPRGIRTGSLLVPLEGRLFRSW